MGSKCEFTNKKNLFNEFTTPPTPQKNMTKAFHKYWVAMNSSTQAP